MKAQNDSDCTVDLADVATPVALSAWQIALEKDRALRARLHQLDPEAAQEEVSFFPTEIAISALVRRNAAYPERIISAFEHELAMATR